jgi:hypothetical protein
LSRFASFTLTLQTKQIIRRHQLLSTSKSCSCIRPDPSRRGRTHTIAAGTSSYRTTTAVSHVIGNKPVRLASHMENRLLLAIRCVDKQFSGEWSALLRHSSFSHRRIAFRSRVGAWRRMRLCEYQPESDARPRVFFRQRVWSGMYGDWSVFFKSIVSSRRQTG